MSQSYQLETLNISVLDLYYLRDQFSGVQFSIRALYLTSSFLDCVSIILPLCLRWGHEVTHPSDTHKYMIY